MVLPAAADVVGIHQMRQRQQALAFILKRGGFVFKHTGGGHKAIAMIVGYLLGSERHNQKEG